MESLDFRVTVEKNLNSEDLEEAIEQFSNKLSRDKSSIGFLYYSGHGCQLNYKGYLVPTDVDTKKRVKIKHRALSINEMLDTLSDAGNRVNMLFLDACRDVPVGARGGKKGLGQPTATPKGSLVVYATEAGKTADDNSNFIDALITNIKKSNQDIKAIADNISNSVADKTGENQIPVVFYKRLPRVVLKSTGGGGYVPPTPKPEPIITSKWMKDTGERAKWKKAKEICRAKGGRLPTIEELRKVVTDCGGIVDDYKNNIKLRTTEKS